MSATKYALRITGEFKQDLKRCKKRGLPMDELWGLTPVATLICLQKNIVVDNWL